MSIAKSQRYSGTSVELQTRIDVEFRDPVELVLRVGETRIDHDVSSDCEIRSWTILIANRFASRRLEQKRGSLPGLLTRDTVSAEVYDTTDWFFLSLLFFSFDPEETNSLGMTEQRSMLVFDDLPNELILIILSHLTKFQLFQSFSNLNRRLNDLVGNFVQHLSLSSSVSRTQFDALFDNHLRSIQSLLCSLSIENDTVGNYLLEKTQFIPLHNLSRLKLIDRALDLHEHLFKSIEPDRLDIVVTPFYPNDPSTPLSFASSKPLQIHLDIGDNAKDFFPRLTLCPTSSLVNVRITFSRLSLYTEWSSCSLPRSIEKLCLSILSIDQLDVHPSIVVPRLKDYQLSICLVPFDLLDSLLPLNTNLHLHRLAFNGQTTITDGQSWKQLLSKYRLVEHFHLQLFHDRSSQAPDYKHWQDQFPTSSFRYDPTTGTFRSQSSTFEISDRLHVNECVQDLNHVQRPSRISHLILRSQYWCSSFDLKCNIHQPLVRRFHHIRRLSTTYAQLIDFVGRNFLNQIQQLDLEFAENYCLIGNSIVEELVHLKSICFSSVFAGIHSLDLHTTIKELVRERLTHLVYLSIDSVHIIGDEQVEPTILQWFSSAASPPTISYVQGKSFTIWF